MDISKKFFSYTITTNKMGIFAYMKIRERKH